jgi:hypothetical protein
LVTCNINRSGERLNPPIFATTPRILIPVLPINDAMILPITGMPNNANTPKNRREELEAATTITKIFP